MHCRYIASKIFHWSKYFAGVLYYRARWGELGHKVQMYRKLHLKQKTIDFKILTRTFMRLSLLPHRYQRQMFSASSLILWSSRSRSANTTLSSPSCRRRTQSLSCFSRRRSRRKSTREGWRRRCAAPPFSWSPRWWKPCSTERSLCLTTSWDILTPLLFPAPSRRPLDSSTHWKGASCSSTSLRICQVWGCPTGQLC